MIQWLRLHTFTVRGTGLISHQETKDPICEAGAAKKKGGPKILHRYFSKKDNPYVYDDVQYHYSSGNCKSKP